MENPFLFLECWKKDPDCLMLMNFDSEKLSWEKLCESEFFLQ